MATADDGIQCRLRSECLLQVQASLVQQWCLLEITVWCWVLFVARYWLSREHCIFRSHFHQCVPLPAVKTLRFKRVVIGVLWYFQLQLFEALVLAWGRKLAEIYLTNVDFSFIIVYCWWTVRNQSQAMENSMPKQQHQKGATSAQLFFIFLRWKAVISWIAYLRSTLLHFRHKQVHLTTYDSLSRNRPSSGWRMVKGPSDEMSAAGVKMQGQKISRETERYNVQ